jgi:hypothetical protein
MCYAIGLFVIVVYALTWGLCKAAAEGDKFYGIK